MNKKWWFFTDGFMDWARKEFPEPLSNHFTYDMLKNIINYVLDKTETREEFLETMISIVPEVTKVEWFEWIDK